MQNIFQGGNKRWDGKARTVRPRRGLAVLIYLGLMVSLLWGLDCPAATNDLFLEATLPVRLGQAEPPYVKRSRVAQINWPALGAGTMQGKAASERKSVRLNLFPDSSYTAWVRQIEVTRNQETIWQGGLEGNPGSEVTLVRKDSLLVGNVSFHGGRFQIRFLEDGIHRIREVDPGGYPREGDPIRIRTAEELSEKVLEQKDLALIFQKLFLPLILKPPIVDLMVAYTPAVQAAAGGISAVNALIALAVSESNTGYANSVPPPIFNEPILFVSVDPGEVAGFWIWGLNSSDIGVYQRYGNGCPEWVMNGGLPKGDSPPIPVLGET